MNGGLLPRMVVAAFALRGRRLAEPRAGLGVIGLLVALAMGGLPSPAAATCLSSGIAASTPGVNFTVNADGTVLDKQTGLLWKRCAEGQTGTDCSGGTALPYTWQAALQRAQSVNDGGGFAGYTDWRLPNHKELASLVEGQCYDPAISGAVFPNTPSAAFWSSSPYAGIPGYAWVVNFFNGSVGFNFRSFTLAVRLVRAGQ